MTVIRPRHATHSGHDIVSYGCYRLIAGDREEAMRAQLSKARPGRTL